MVKDLRKTKIICTIGPATESKDMLKKLVEAGMNCARINFSHGGYEENREKIENVLAIREELDVPLALALDTKGPEIRTGLIRGSEVEKVELKAGQEFWFKYDEVSGNEYETSISYKNMYRDVKPGDRILVADGLLEFDVEEIVGQDIKTRVANDCVLGSHKNVNVPGVHLDLPALSQKDTDDIIAGIRAGIDLIFASFVRRADDVYQIRRVLEENNGKEIGIISKIESQEGIDNFESILEVSDGIMIARGDMGVEIPMERVPIVQKQFIKRCNEVGKPVITATQMLETMITNPCPTRAEVSDAANSVYDQTGCMMLSGETAAGKYPVECVKTMDRISKAIESNLKYWGRFESHRFMYGKDNVRANICYSNCITAKDMEADCILAYTYSGYTANVFSGFRIKCPIFAITDNIKTYYKLAIVQNVTPIFVNSEGGINAMINEAVAKLEEKGILSKGDRVIVVGESTEILGNIENSLFGSFMVI